MKVYLKEGRNPGTVISDSNVPLELHIDLDDEETTNRLEGMAGQTLIRLIVHHKGKRGCAWLSVGRGCSAQASTLRVTLTTQYGKLREATRQLTVRTVTKYLPDEWYPNRPEKEG